MSDDAKFQPFIHALPSDIFASITPVITNLTPGQIYDGVKTALTAAFGKATRQHLQELEAVQS